LSQITINLPEPGDKEAVSALMTASLIEEYGNPPDSETLTNLLDFYFSRSDSNIFCLKEEGIFAGFLWLIDSSDVITGVPFSCILYLAVKPEFRGKKYARFLMEKAKAHCKQEKIGELRLTVRYNNDTALNLYKTAGFKTYKHEMLLSLDEN
jgi:ribosomal protein S18 acetylase RimI-like enzyme